MTKFDSVCYCKSLPQLPINDAPCLSVEDIMNFFREHYEKTKECHPPHGIIREGMILLAKQKLND